MAPCTSEGQTATSTALSVACTTTRARRHASHTSRTIVTGPSFTSETSIRAPKTPVCDRHARDRAAPAQKRSYRGSAASGRGCLREVGRVPFWRLLSAMSVNWLTTSAAPPCPRRERSNRPASFSKIRRPATLVARRSAPSSVSSAATPRRTSRPGPTAATASPPTDDRRLADALHDCAHAGYSSSSSGFRGRIERASLMCGVASLRLPWFTSARPSA